MTDDTIPEPISAEGLAELLDGIASLSTPLKFSERVTVRGARNTLRVQDAEIAILRSRIAQLEAERARWTTFEVRDPGAFIVAD